MHRDWLILSLRRYVFDNTAAIKTAQKIFDDTAAQENVEHDSMSIQFCPDCDA